MRCSVKFVQEHLAWNLVNFLPPFGLIYHFIDWSPLLPHIIYLFEFFAKYVNNLWVLRHILKFNKLWKCIQQNEKIVGMIMYFLKDFHLITSAKCLCFLFENFKNLTSLLCCLIFRNKIDLFTNVKELKYKEKKYGASVVNDCISECYKLFTPSCPLILTLVKISSQRLLRQ